MLRHFLTITLRNFFLQRTFTFINVMGLAIGLACAILIYLYLHDELTYDTLHPEAENSYRIGVVYTNEAGESQNIGYVPGIWAKALVENYPDVNTCTRNFWLGYPTSIINREADKILLSEKLHWVDSTYPEVLMLPLVQGDKDHVFKPTHSMAISQSVAKALFGTEDPMGKTVELQHVSFNGASYPVTITGVFKDFPSNSHIQPDYLVNMNLLEQQFGENFHSSWEGWFLASYVNVQAQTTQEDLAAYMNQLLDTNMEGEDREALSPFFTKLTDLHFDDTAEWVNEGAGDMSYIYVFASIALLILIVASINYMNLATARSARRAKEIGLRKTMGSNRSQLIAQFFGESLLTVFISLALAVLIVLLVLPAFNDLAGKDFRGFDLIDPWIIISLVGASVLVAFFSGLYPAVYLSSFMPVKVLRNRFTPGKGPELFRKVLVTLQFAISVVLLVCTGIMFLQMRFIQGSKLSQEGDQMVSIRFGGSAPAEKYPVFRSEVMKDADLSEVTLANHLPRQEYFGPINWNIRFPGVNENEYDWSVLNAEHNFPQMFGLELISGHFFEPQQPGDTLTNPPFLMNETAARNLGLSPDSALGTAVSIQVGENTLTGQVIGVIKDFTYRSMKTQIDPTLITTYPHPIDKIIYVKLPKTQIAQKLESLEASWKSIFPGMGFDYWFVDDEFGRMYLDESRVTQLAEVFSLLAILVACLGVFGLASYLAERRTKEIGIRKILGASLPSLLLLLTQTFLFIIGIAALAGIPTSYLLMTRWLQNFVYKIDISWWVFALALVLILALTLITVSYETLRTAKQDPIKNLRTE